MAIPDLVVIDSSSQGAATCVVCGQEVQPGAGVTARFRGRTFRFKCAGCLSRFGVDPDHYLADGPESCCDGAGHEAPVHQESATDWVM